MKALERRNPVLASFFDLTKAFDTVSYTTLLNKLSFYRFDGVSTKLLSSYLNGRHQAVFLNGSQSQYRLLKYGVSQGSVLGPTLFLIYVNDLPEFIRSECLETFLFADDLAINVIRDNITSSISDMNKISSKVHDWCCNNNLAINTAKTESLNFSLSRQNSSTDKSVLVSWAFISILSISF